MTIGRYIRNAGKHGPEVFDLGEAVGVQVGTAVQRAEQHRPESTPESRRRATRGERTAVHLRREVLAGSFDAVSRIDKHLIAGVELPIELKADHSTATIALQIAVKLARRAVMEPESEPVRDALELVPREVSEHRQLPSDANLLPHGHGFDRRCPIFERTVVQAHSTRRELVDVALHALPGNDGGAADAQLHTNRRDRPRLLDDLSEHLSGGSLSKTIGQDTTYEDPRDPDALSGRAFAL
ncbi:MAG: hypothetical protein ABIO06_02715, partial [Pseudolysinimonas sp.]